MDEYEYDWSSSVSEKPTKTESQPQPNRPLGGVLSRALRLRCPRCGEGKLFCGFFRMDQKCESCGLKYERAPGYFLGSAYINYGVTAVVLTVVYVWLALGRGIENRDLIAPMLALVILFPLFFFRYARSLWLAMDCYLDKTDFAGEEDEA